MASLSSLSVSARRAVVALVSALAGGFVLIAGQPPLQAQPEQAQIARRLIDRAQREGKARVIVGVRAPFMPEGPLQTADLMRQRAGIATAQSRVIDQLAGLSISEVRRYESIPFFAAHVSAAALERLAQMPEVASIQEDVADAPALAESTTLIGATSARSAGYNGNGWAIAILDTGIQTTHPFLAGAVASEACYSHVDVGQTSLCPGGTTSSTAPGSGVDCSAAFAGCDHGTHVAGIAAGRGYPGGPAYSGVAHQAALISIQVFTGFDAPSCGGTPCVLTYTSDQISALQRVYDLRDTYRIAAVNMSLGGGRYDDQAVCDSQNAARKAAIDQLRSVGIGVVIASGNSGFTGSMSAPGCISSAISVGSTDDGSLSTVADRLSSFSNSAPFLNLLAPGNAITSSVPGGFAVFAGTSMAAPHVAGAWALMKQRKPLAVVTEILNAFTATGAQVTDGRPVNFAAGDTITGVVKPRIDVATAINAVRVDYMSVDAPQAGAIGVQPFTMSGWALNMSAPAGTGVDAVHVWAFPAAGSPVLVGAATYGSSRADVGAAYGGQFASSGWAITVNGLPPGVYTLNAYARNTFNGMFSQVKGVSDVIVGPDPRVTIDTPANDSAVAEPFTFSGWAIDRAAAAGTGVDAIHVYAYPNPGSGTSPIFVGTADYGFARANVGALFGAQFTNSGWGIPIAALPPAPYQLVAYAHSTVSRSFGAVESVFVKITQPVMTIDMPADNSTVSQPFVLSGWALDLGAPAGAGVDAIHVWAYQDPGSGTPPVFVGAASFGTARPDVGGAFGTQFTNSGYSISASGLAPGHVYLLAVFAHSSVSGTFNALQTVSLTIP
jgi:subtilisin family serine protease